MADGPCAAKHVYALDPAEERHAKLPRTKATTTPTDVYPLEPKPARPRDICIFRKRIPDLDTTLHYVCDSGSLLVVYPSKIETVKDSIDIDTSDFCGRGNHFFAGGKWHMVCADLIVTKDPDVVERSPFDIRPLRTKSGLQFVVDVGKEAFYYQGGRPLVNERAVFNLGKIYNLESPGKWSVSYTVSGITWNVVKCGNHFGVIYIKEDKQWSGTWMIICDSRGNNIARQRVWATEPDYENDTTTPLLYLIDSDSPTRIDAVTPDGDVICHETESGNWVSTTIALKVPIAPKNRVVAAVRVDTDRVLLLVSDSPHRHYDTFRLYIVTSDGCRVDLVRSVTVCTRFIDDWAFPAPARLSPDKSTLILADDQAFSIDLCM